MTAVYSIFKRKGVFVIYKKVLSVVLSVLILSSIFSFKAKGETNISEWKNGGLSVPKESSLGYSEMEYGFTKLTVTDARGCITTPNLDKNPYYLMVGMQGQFPLGHWAILHISNGERNSSWNPKNSPNDIYISFPNPNTSPKNITVSHNGDDEQILTGVPFMPQTAYVFKFEKKDNKLQVFCNGTMVFEGAEQLALFKEEKLWFTTDGNIGDNDTFTLYPMFINPISNMVEDPDRYYTTGPKSGCNGYSPYISDLINENMTVVYDDKGYAKAIINSTHNDPGNPERVGESVSTNIENPNKEFELSVIADKVYKENWCSVGIYDSSKGEKSFDQSEYVLCFSINNGCNNYVKYKYLDKTDDSIRTITVIPPNSRVKMGECMRLRVSLLEGENAEIRFYYNDCLEQTIYEGEDNTAELFSLLRAQTLRVGIVGSKNAEKPDEIRLKVKNGAENTGFVSLSMEGVSIRYDNPKGLRFETRIAGLNHLSEGTQVRVGTLIVPYSYLTDGTSFTETALLAAQKAYLDVKCSVWSHVPDKNRDYFIVKSVISNIKEKNYSCDFAARAYVEITHLDGTVKRLYSDFDPKYSVSSISKEAYLLKYNEEVFDMLNDSRKAFVKELAYYYLDYEKYDGSRTFDLTEYDIGDDATAIMNALQSIKTMKTDDKTDYNRINSILEIPNNRYELNQSIILNGIEDLTIDGNGSTLVFTENVTAIIMNSCKNVIFKNFNIDYDPLRYTQGVVKSINGNKCVVEIDAGYSSDINFINGLGVDDSYGELHYGQQTFSVNIHDETGAVKPNTPTYVFKTNAVSLGGNSVELEAITNSLFEGKALDYMAVGDEISLVFAGPKLFWADYNRGGIVFEDINVYSASGAGFWELGGEGGTIYRNVCVAPGPKPEGAQKERVLAMAGDCIHSTMLKRGPVIDGCTFTNLADDVINLNGMFYYVLSCSGNKTVIAPRWDYPFYVGEQIKGYDYECLGLLGAGRILQFEARRDSSLEDEIKKFCEFTDRQWGDSTLVYEITTDKPLNLKNGDYVVSAERNCPGAVIKNSLFGKNRSRGIVVKGDNILIVNNIISGCMFPSIAVQIDTAFGEAGFSSNVTIRGNQITNSTLGKDMTTSINRDSLGAIMVNILFDRAHNGLIKSIEHHNIVIEDNIIDGTAVYGISCTNVDGLTIRNNRISNPFMYGIGKVGENAGISPNAGVFIGQCKNVTVTGNDVCGGPKEIINAIQIHESVYNIINASNNTKE